MRIFLCLFLIISAPVFGMEIYFTPSLDCEENIIKRINSAERIEIAVYSITNKNIVSAIQEAHGRGIKIRIVTDQRQSSGKDSLVPELRTSGLSLRTNRKITTEHNKFAIFDNAEVVSGSYNWTASATKRNSENCLFFQQPDNEYSKRFEELWELYKP